MQILQLCHMIIIVGGLIEVNCEFMKFLLPLCKTITDFIKVRSLTRRGKLVKVSKSRKQIMKSRILPKNKRNILKRLS